MIALCECQVEPPGYPHFGGCPVQEEIKKVDDMVNWRRRFFQKPPLAQVLGFHTAEEVAIIFYLLVCTLQESIEIDNIINLMQVDNIAVICLRKRSYIKGCGG